MEGEHASALRWGVAFVGITLLGVAHPIREKHFKCGTCTGGLMSAKLIHVLSSFHMLFCAFYIHIHVKLITFPLNLVL